MSWIEHVLDLIWPEATAKLKASITSFRTHRLRERNRFVLKAMATEEGQLVAPIPGERRYDLTTIDRRVYIAQMTEACGDIPLFLDDRTPEQLSRYEAMLKRQQKLGLPHPKDVDRERKIEVILQEMTEINLLAFHPPNMWVIR